MVRRTSGGRAPLVPADGDLGLRLRRWGGRMPRMSYPDARYLADAGVASARFRPDGHAPEISNPSGTTTHYLATGESTGGEFGLYRWEMGPTPSGPDPHFHRTISESFYILSGTIRLYDGT